MAVQAQVPAGRPATLAVTEERIVVQYSANESGGRVTIVHPPGDSAVVESIRLRLLEAAAAIRRGDLRSASMLPDDARTAASLAQHRELIRCTFRPLPRGGELVLFSDDDSTVAEIHRLLSGTPPELSIP